MIAVVVVVGLLAAAVALPAWLLRDLCTVRSETSEADGPRHASVSVVIPARDEEATLPELLASLQHLTIEPAEIVVVDDDSRDATAAVARAAGARVLTAGAPPLGWTGKAWACDSGARATAGELLLFLDADTALAPGALSSLLQLHREHGGLVSVQPFHRVEQAYEQVSAYFNVMALLASGAFGAAPSRRPIAFGPCLLTSRVDYAGAGGHAAVRSEILDDVRLAAAYRRAGLPVWCAAGGSAIRMRSYPGGPRQFVAGWSKNFASGAAATDPRAALASVLWIGAHHGVAVGSMLSMLAAVTGWGGSLVSGSPGLWALAWVATAWQLRRLLRRVGSFRWWTWALFPLPLLAFDLIFARSAVLTVVRRSVRWRGREVDLRRSASPEEVA